MMNDGGVGEQMLIPEKKQNLPSRLTLRKDHGGQPGCT